MFDSFKESMSNFSDKLQAKYQGISDSMSELHSDLSDMRDIFVWVKNIIASTFSFIGYETGILLICTCLFLFVTNLVPFLFFNKYLRYFAGIVFGVFLSFFFDYELWSLTKYILIMLSPMLLEYILIWIFKLTGKSVKGVLSAALFAVKGFFITLFKKLFSKKEKSEEN